MEEEIVVVVVVDRVERMEMKQDGGEMGTVSEEQEPTLGFYAGLRSVEKANHAPILVAFLGRNYSEIEPGVDSQATSESAKRVGHEKWTVTCVTMTQASVYVLSVRYNACMRDKDRNELFRWI